MSDPAALPREMTVLGGRYRLLQRLGQGGHADVFLAEQLSLQRKVALKVISRSQPRQADAAARFKREALIHSSIDHPSVVRILDFETEGPEGTVVVLEYVDGRRLDEFIAGRAVPVLEAARLLLQLAEGLAAIHGKGVVHRDFKAENVMVAGQQARILDFGLARLFDADLLEGDGRSFVSTHGLVAGTPAYLSPEQFRGMPADPRSDVYAFGITAHFMLTGKLPFPGPEPVDYVAQHTTQTAPSLRGRVPNVLAAFVERALEKEPSKRQADGMSLAAQLVAMMPELNAAPPKARKRARAWPYVVVSLLVASAPFIAIERLWEPASQARWLLRLGQPEAALARTTAEDVVPRALALEALGRTDELKVFVKANCLKLASELEAADRARLGVSFAGCQ